eukprot:scaffold229099_cov32-Tisochrysis_lutea.AAC.4
MVAGFRTGQRRSDVLSASRDALLLARMALSKMDSTSRSESDKGSQSSLRKDPFAAKELWLAILPTGPGVSTRGMGGMCEISSPWDGAGRIVSEDRPNGTPAASALATVPCEPKACTALKW